MNVIIKENLTDKFEQYAIKINIKCEWKFHIFTILQIFNKILIMRINLRKCFDNLV